jgi:uncharacterized metal-binding protein
VESHDYGTQARFEETMAFARNCACQRLGIAFCIGLRREAAILCKILAANGFEVESAVCKNGAYPNGLLGIDDDKVTLGSFEPTCNPIGQACCLEEAGTQLAIVLGLCVGDDSLFLAYSRAPVAVPAAKDRVLGHNAPAALYSTNVYYRGKLSASEASPAGQACAAAAADEVANSG